MNLRRGKYARLDAAGPTVTMTSTWRRLLTAVHRRWSR